MSLSRREFVRNLGFGRADTLSGAWIAARGREAAVAEFGPHAADAMLAPPEVGEVRISSNENPLGPGQKGLEAILGAFADAGRYPMNSRPAAQELRGLIAKVNAAKPEQVVLGAGSGEILDNAVHAFTSKTRHLVTADPSFEAPVGKSRDMAVPVKAIPVDRAGKLDLAGMAAAATGAGLIFVCNPNNPTATVHSEQAIRDFVNEVRRSSPDTVILLDEAYHHYVTDPSYASGIPLALSTPSVFVSRTFSKAYGMAGMRLGYAIGHADVMKRMAQYAQPYSSNVLVIAAAAVQLDDPQFIPTERDRNTKVRKFTMDFFRSAGFEATDAQANFIFVNIRRPAKEFRDGCAKHKVFVGRDFPPFEKTHARISIGTMDEMQRAVEVFRQVLGAAPTAASRG